MNSLESLPDELFLLIFGYLHKFDILYSFRNLNQRFQQITTPFLYHIDLTDANISYKHYQKTFVRHILPVEAHHIQSLKLYTDTQTYLFRLHIRQLRNLQSLSLAKYDQIVHSTERFVIETDQLPYLSELSITQQGHHPLKTVTATCSTLLHKLTTLILITDRDAVHELTFDDRNLQLPHMKRLKIAQQYTLDLSKLFQICPNLEELSLSLSILCAAHRVPETLKKLHLECGNYTLKQYQPNFEEMQKFLHIFKGHLHSFTLIVDNAKEEFSNFGKFCSLVSDSIHLQKFEYRIHTYHSLVISSTFSNVRQLPDSSYILYTLPLPVPFDTLRDEKGCSFRTGLDLQMLHNIAKLYIYHHSPNAFIPAATMSEITSALNSKHRFVKLKTLMIGDVAKVWECDEKRQFLSTIIPLSPNLTTLIMVQYGDEIEHTMRILKEVCFVSSAAIDQARKISHFKLESDGWRIGYYGREIFDELSKLFPNLKSLETPCPSDFIDNYSAKIKRTLTSVVSSIFKRPFTRASSSRRRTTTGRSDDEDDLLDECVKWMRNLFCKLSHLKWNCTPLDSDRSRSFYGNLCRNLMKRQQYQEDGEGDSRIQL